MSEEKRDFPMAANFLVEIGTEELPPKTLLELASAFRDEFDQARMKAGIVRGADIDIFATPRRLALRTQLDDRQTDIHRETAGPPLASAFDRDGNPTRAALGFAARFGVAVGDLQTIDSDKGPRLAYSEVQLGRPTLELLGSLVETALNALPIAKRMRWGARRHEFVRPIHWIVMLFDGRVCDGPVLGIPAGDRSRGHRFHAPGEIVISSPADYEKTLRQAHVIARFDERRASIRDMVRTAAAEAGGQAVIDDGLLDEVTALTEWPVPLLGRFDAAFLEVPPEALISSMKGHQKYFPVVDTRGRLLPQFVTVANIASADTARVIEGNERVIRPRLADAAFFYQSDCRTSLSDRREQLRSIVFQEKLGSLHDKTTRVAALAASIAAATNGNPTLALRAGELCKSDLASDMVGEFAELQGTMGRYYAINDSEHPEVAEALAEHYLPTFAGDRLPETATGNAVALADRIDTLVGIFGIGLLPTGSRDPFALRRASLGVLRILIENAIDLDLGPVLDLALDLHRTIEQRQRTKEQVLTYFLDRFMAWYVDQGIAAEVVQSVIAKRLTNALDTHQRVLAVHQFSQLIEAPQLAAANKRVSNILARTDENLAPVADARLIQHDAEKSLHAAMQQVSTAVAPLLAARNYTEALREMAALRQPVDVFFDQVMVNVEERAVRRNRLALLADLRNMFLQIADISHLVPASK